ncbi:MAG: helix-turn-helix domain-containing protein [Rhodospirillaceae bacterium]|nr:helix-turn-helix domain-containing protein [Rhodospirillaceae bacterium]MYK58441.1 helix-turn-helix domain-containing protein [Rhodospirillaceae bacterium]
MSWQTRDAVDDCPRKLPSGLRSVLLALAGFADQHGRNAYPSVARLAEITRLSERQVRRHLAEARRLGLIEMIRAGGGDRRQTTVYAFNLEALADCRTPDIHDRGDMHDTPDMGDRHPCHGCPSPLTWATVTPDIHDRESVNEPSMNPSLSPPSLLSGLASETGPQPERAAFISELTDAMRELAKAHANDLSVLATLARADFDGWHNVQSCFQSCHALAFSFLDGIDPDAAQDALAEWRAITEPAALELHAAVWRGEAA